MVQQRGGHHAQRVAVHGVKVAGQRAAALVAEKVELEVGGPHARARRGQRAPSIPRWPLTAWMLWPGGPFRCLKKTRW